MKGILPSKLPVVKDVSLSVVVADADIKKSDMRAVRMERRWPNEWFLGMAEEIVEWKNLRAGVRFPTRVRDPLGLKPSAAY